MPIDDPSRGFSFRADGPLDMRMGAAGRTAADLVNTLPEGDLADTLFRLAALIAEEADPGSVKRFERGIAKARTKDSMKALGKLTNGGGPEGRRIISDPPLIR